MRLPSIAIVGRPNVGKSSLFNMLARRRANIVDPTPGVTRDRVTAICDIDDHFFELVDTGGHGIVDRDDLSEHVEQQIRCAIERADLILFLVDAREGLTPLDRSTAELLRPVATRVRLIANKVDEPHMASQIGEFTRLGYGEAMPLSAANGNGRLGLRELIIDFTKELGGDVPADPTLRLALVGKRNAGKSSFLNALAGEERVIVSEIPGTTRDSIDVRFEKDGRVLVAIDTAGVRKLNRMEDDVEFFAYTRATESIRRADVVLFLIDSTVPIGQVDKRLSHLIANEYKPCVLVVNKWDLAKGKASTEDYGTYLSKTLKELDYAPIVFTSAVTGKNIPSAVDLASELLKQSRTRVGTGRLNQILQNVLDERMPRPKRGRRAPKFYYATQVSTQPPTIVVFVNSPALVTTDYERFLMNRFREQLPFAEVPIRLAIRARNDRQAGAGAVTRAPTPRRKASVTRTEE